MTRKLRFERLDARTLFAADFDIDANGRVDCLDSLAMIDSLHGFRPFNSRMDLDGDGRVSVGDVLKVTDRVNSDFSVSFSLMANRAGSNGGGPRPKFEYWRAGSSADSPAVSSEGGLGLVGGGLDVDRVFEWMGKKSFPKDSSGNPIASASGGDFLVLRAVGTDAYNPYIQSLVSMNSVSTLLIPDRTSAYDPTVISIINNAEAIFIAGGDQADYFNYWNETPVEDAIYNAIQRNIPIGGTSAGLAVLGDYDFTASTGKTIVSNDALLDPYNSAITIDGNSVSDGFLTLRDNLMGSQSSVTGVLSLLANTITDSHFRQRDRLGRLVTFMALLDADDIIKQSASLTVKGIGINEQTALLIEPDGRSMVVGNNLAGSTDLPRSVYFMEHLISAGSQRLTSPLTYSDTQVTRVDYDPAASTFQIWSGFPEAAKKYSVSATGKLASRKVAELTSTSSAGIYS
jgi:cyanophycinase